MTTQDEKFLSYCWEFYGPEGIYGHFFDHNLTLDELKQALKVRKIFPNFEGDSIDRELIRDVILVLRGKPPQGF